MDRSWIWYLAKGLEGLGLLVVLWGLMLSMKLGFGDSGLESMKAESYGLIAGILLFAVGWGMERAIGSR